MQGFNRDFNQPDETRPFKGHGHLDVVKLGEATIGRGVFEPGWKWSVDVKPLAGTASCQNAHTGYCLSGAMTIQMDSGEKFVVRSGEAFYLHPGHDAWTEGNQPCVMIDVSGFSNYAKPH